jgi:membrane-anchored mycosin MYCP
MAASAEYDVARYEQRTDRERPPETYFTKCLCDTVRDGIPGQGSTLSVDAIYRQMVTTMRARQLVHPTQANRGTASTFPFARNVAALREPATPEPGEHRVPGPRPSRMATLRRSRLVVVLLVALVAAATTLIVLRADDTPADDTLADTTREDIDNLVTPPPVTEAPPNDTGAPDRSYEQHTACVETLSSTPTATASWGQERFDFPKLHALATGQGQTVAVIDTGVNPHPLFQERLHQGNDYVSSEEPQDCDGHGTAIAGLIAADTGTARDDDFQGMAPKATILAIRQSSETFGYRDGNGSDTGSVGTLETLAQAIMGAADANVDVIAITVHSCRLADAGPINDAEQSVQAALRYAVDDADVVVVAAAGDVPGCQSKNNDDPNRPSVIPTPAWFSDHVLSVAALTRGGRLTNFSVRGPWVGVAAPGTEITTLDPNLDGLISLSETDIAYDTRTSRSTSYAAAYVAGLAALVRDYRPDLDARQVMNRIKYTADHPQGGRNDQVGYGMIRPVEALTATVPDE